MIKLFFTFAYFFSFIDYKQLDFVLASLVVFFLWFYPIYHTMSILSAFT